MLVNHEYVKALMFVVHKPQLFSHALVDFVDNFTRLLMAG